MSEPDAPTPPPTFPTTTETELACPHCGQSVAVTLLDLPQTLVCPNCQHEFVAPALDGATNIADESGNDEETDQVPTDMLTAVRIRELAAERRATYRAGSYCLIAAGVCAVAIAQLAWMIVQHIRQRHAWGLQCTGYLLFIALAAYGLVYFFLQARRLHREAKRSSLDEPTTPPDFSTLDDGSKRVANLKEIR